MGKDANQMKLFKCYDCGQQFYVTSDELEDVVCRNCQSDNVTPVNNTTMWLKILTFVAIAVVGCGTALFFMKGEEPKQGGDSAGLPPIEHPQDTLPKVNQELLKIISLSNSIVEHKDYIYSFVADCKFKDKEKVHFKYEYQLMEKEGGKILQKSSDGKFENLKPTDTESYYFKVTISDGKNTIETDSKQVIGFKKKPIIQYEVANPWTKEQLEEAILERKASKEVNFIARSPKISYINLREEEGSGPKNLQDVQSRLDYDIWAGIKVQNIGYNQRKEINSIELEVIYP